MVLYDHFVIRFEGVTVNLCLVATLTLPCHDLSLLCWPGHGLIAIKSFKPSTTFSQCVHSC